MAEERRCPQCGAEMAADAPMGVCPRCVLNLAAETQQVTQPASTPQGEGSSRASFVPPSPQELAASFPQLEVLELLGQGGMGAVYKARQPGLDRLVALKILPPGIGAGPAFAERFAREARSLARLNHPNIVGVYDFGQAGGLYYFVMEYVDGVNLRQMERREPLAPKEALAIVPQICDALQYAHDEGIVHRDIKPENILIDKKGRVKIADFGLAKLLVKAPTDYTLTQPQQVMGTVHYMAPEQVEHPGDVDQRADIYSLGVVFYEMLTGELPLGRFAPPSQKVQVDVRLDEVVLKTLEKEPARRYQHASEVRTEVEHITRGPQGPAETPSRADAQDTPQFSRKAIWAVIWACGVPLAILALVYPLRPTFDPESAGALWRLILGWGGCLVGASAAIGAPLLGLLAMHEIRYSRGRVVGLPLAFGSGVAFPLLLLAFVLAYSFGHMFAGMDIRVGSEAKAMLTLFVPLIVCSFIAVAAWRKVRPPVVPPAGGGPMPSRRRLRRRAGLLARVVAWTGLVVAGVAVVWPWVWHRWPFEYHEHWDITLVPASGAYQSVTLSAERRQYYWGSQWDNRLLTKTAWAPQAKFDLAEPGKSGTLHFDPVLERWGYTPPGEQTPRWESANTYGVDVVGRLSTHFGIYSSKPGVKDEATELVGFIKDAVNGIAPGGRRPAELMGFDSRKAKVGSFNQTGQAHHSISEKGKLGLPDNAEGIMVIGPLFLIILAPGLVTIVRRHRRRLVAAHETEHRYRLGTIGFWATVLCLIGGLANMILPWVRITQYLPYGLGLGAFYNWYGTVCVLVFFALCLFCFATDFLSLGRRWHGLAITVAGAVIVAVTGILFWRLTSPGTEQAGLVTTVGCWHQVDVGRWGWGRSPVARTLEQQGGPGAWLAFALGLSLLVLGYVAMRRARGRPPEEVDAVGAPHGPFPAVARPEVKAGFAFAAGNTPRTPGPSGAPDSPDP